MPLQLSVVGSLSIPVNPIDIDVQGNYAYVVFSNPPGTDIFRVINVADKTNPAVVGGGTLTLPGNAIALFVKGNYAYLVYDNEAGNNIFRIIDISDPANPIMVSGEALSLPANARNIFVKDSHAFIIFLNQFILPNVPVDGTARCVIVDEEAGFAFFATDTSPSKIYKLRLSDFTIVNSLTLDAGEDDVRTAVIDKSTGFGYFGAQTDPGLVIKVRLSDLTKIATISTWYVPRYIRASAIDVINGYAYFGGSHFPLSGAVAQIRLSDFTFTNYVISYPGGTLSTAFIDVANDSLYFSALIPFPGMLLKYTLSTFGTIPVAARLAFSPGFDDQWTAFIDDVNGFGYIAGRWTQYGRAIKIRLSDFTQVGTLNFTVGAIRSSTIDIAGDAGYFSGGGRINKVRLSDFSILGDVRTDLTGYSSVLDIPNNIIFLGDSGKIAKVSLIEPFLLFDGIRVIDVTDPGNPTIVGGYNLSLPDGGKDITIQGNLAYLLFSAKLIVTNTAIHPNILGYKDLPGFDVRSIKAKENLAIIRCSDSIRIYDVSNLQDIKLISAITEPSNAIDVFDNNLYTVYSFYGGPGE